MSKSITVSYEGNPCYDILLEHDFEKFIGKIKKSGYLPTQKVCIVTDSNLEKLHLEVFQNRVKSYFHTVISFCFSAVEQQKNLDTVQLLYQRLISNHFDRHDLLIAFGGGVVGDLTGFTAATYLRGVDFIQIPTTLLSQVDSSIGGKTGVDFMQYKNMVGAFYQPKLVYMNLSLLQTLPKEQFISGMGEVLKHGLIKSRDYFFWMQSHRKEILYLRPDIIEEMIYQSCLIKRNVVELDPREKGDRALLNFGHTIGHAIEKLSDFQLFHGQCVGIGMALSCRLSADLGYISKEACNKVIETLEEFGLPVSVKGLNADEILSVSKSDKKMTAGKIKFILLNAVGNAFIYSDLTDDQILSVISGVLQDADGKGKEE